VVELFTRNRDMLDDYFSLQIETIGRANRDGTHGHHFENFFESFAPCYS
jgi:hypothetical protein